jgi:hypothetical protein
VYAGWRCLQDGIFFQICNMLQIERVFSSKQIWSASNLRIASARTSDRQFHEPLQAHLVERWATFSKLRTCSGKSARKFAQESTSL